MMDSEMETIILDSTGIFLFYVVVGQLFQFFLSIVEKMRQSKQ